MCINVVFITLKNIIVKKLNKADIFRSGQSVRSGYIADFSDSLADIYFLEQQNKLICI